MTEKMDNFTTVFNRSISVVKGDHFSRTKAAKQDRGMSNCLDTCQAQSYLCSMMKHNVTVDITHTHT